MSKAENARMIRFFRWLCDNRKMAFWDAENEMDLLDQIVSKSETKMVSAAAAPGYARRCATKLVEQNVFGLFPDEYTAVCRALEDFVAFAESETTVKAAAPWSVQECLYAVQGVDHTEGKAPLAVAEDSYEKELRLAGRILEALQDSFADAARSHNDAKLIFQSIRKKLVGTRDEPALRNVSREAYLPLEEDMRYRRLRNKLLRAFDEENKAEKIHYIGEIQISDEEYGLMLDFTRYQLKHHTQYAPGIGDSPLVATALVQIGIRTYDGRYWPHAAKELGMEKIPPQSQRFLNETFQNTARKHGFLVLADAQTESRAFQSILFHGIVSNYYAPGLFDLLFQYYDRDLGRNLEQNTPERMKMLLDMLCQREKIEEEADDVPQRAAGSTSKAYRLRKHTLAALTAFPEVNVPRLIRYVEMIDAAFWYQQLPEKGASRLTECFRAWAEKSPEMRAQYRLRNSKTGATRRRRHFQMPYLHADLQNGGFELRLPEQLLRQPVESESVIWRIQGRGGLREEILCETAEVLCGYKTDAACIGIAPMAVLPEIVCSLCVGDQVLNRFRIPGVSARFFDGEGDQENTLSAGECVGFTTASECLQSAALLGDEVVGDLHRWEFSFEEGDVVLLPDGTSGCIGGNYTEGLLHRGRVTAVMCEGLSSTLLPVYNAAPEILLLVEKEKMEGISLFVNATRYRLTDCNCKSAGESNQSGKIWILLSTADFPEVQNNTVNSLVLELPGAAFARSPIAFALCEGLHVTFEDAPYIFEERGTIAFSPEVKVECAPGTNYDRSTEGNSFNFELAQPDGKLHFVLSDGKLPIVADVPALSWSEDEENWCLAPLGDVWERDFPFALCLRGPFQTVGFDFGIDPGVMKGENAGALLFEKNRQTGLFRCDLTRARSWITRDRACYQVKLLLDGTAVSFGRIFAKSILLSDKIELVANFEQSTLTLLCDILGRSKEYYADIRHKDSGRLLATKEPFDGRRLELHCEIPNGEYEVVVYETDDDDFFDDTYYVLGTHSCTLLDRDNLSGKQIRLKYVSRRLYGSFRLPLKGNQRVCRLQRQSSRIYKAELTDDGENAKTHYQVQLILPEAEELSRFFLKCWDETYKEYYEFDYDRKQNLLLTDAEEEKNLPYNLRYRRYTTLFEDQDEFVGVFEDEPCPPKDE